MQKIGFVDIELPSAVDKGFSILIDLAETFRTEFQSDAVKLLKSQINSIDLKPKPSIDYEGDSSFIRSSNAKTILETSIIINQHSKNNFGIENYDEILQFLLNSQKNRPKPIDFKIGDIFTIKLSDKSFTYGQVLSKEPTTCALLNIKNNNDLTPQIDNNLKAISICHTGLSEQLVTGEFAIVKNTQPLFDPNSGHGGKPNSIGSISYGCIDILKSIAEAYYGLTPWNVMADENYFKSKLQKNINVPDTAIVLNNEERAVYRFKKFGM